jgi:RNA polymerase sigma-70 factor (ECF subfamily)
MSVQPDDLTAQFEANRTRLRAVAYRMLGSHPEAEDAVQETWIKLHRADTDAVDNLGGWLTTVTARVCLDRLRARQARPEEPVGARVDDESVVASDPADDVLMADSIGAALLVVLDSLSPAERVAFVLHDVFAVPFEEIADVVGRSPDATRQLASRARRRVQGSEQTSRLDPRRQREVVEAFLRAARGGEFESLVRLLDPDVTFVPDAAALAMGSLQPTRGAEAVATMLSGGAKLARLVLVDGLAGWAWAPGGQIRGLVRFTVVDGTIVAIDVTSDAERLAALDVVFLDS